MDLSQLNKLSKTINTVINPNVYSHDADKINKPMEDIPFGHILNVNWDNIAANYGIIQYFLSQALYLDMVSTEAEANKIVKRGTAGGIQVGDIYTTTAIGDPLNTGDAIAFKSNGDSKIKYTTDYTKFREVIGIVTSSSAGLDLNIEKLPKDVSGTSGAISLSDASLNYNCILVHGTSNWKWTGNNSQTIVLTDGMMGNIIVQGQGLAVTWNKANKILNYGAKDGGKGARIFAIKGIA